MIIVIAIFAGIGLAWTLWVLARCIATWAYWHKTVSADISVLQAEQKLQSERLHNAHDRITKLAMDLTPMPEKHDG